MKTLIFQAFILYLYGLSHIFNQNVPSQFDQIISQYKKNGQGLPANVGNNIAFGGDNNLGGINNSIADVGLPQLNKLSSLPFNVGVDGNPTAYVNSGQLTVDPITVQSDISKLSLVISSATTNALNNPELELFSDTLQITIGGDLVKGGVIDSTPKSLSLAFTCAATSKINFNLNLISNSSGHLQLKFQKDCQPGLLDTVYRYLNYLYYIIISILVLFTISTILYFYYGGTTEVYVTFIKNLIEKKSRSNENYEDTYNIKSSQKDWSYDPKFYESKFLINSKRIKFDYENYGGCS